MKRKRKFYLFFGIHFWGQNLDFEVKYSYYSKYLETLWTFNRKIKKKYMSKILLLVQKVLDMWENCLSCQKSQICENLASTVKEALKWIFMDQSIFFFFFIKYN